jgi:hypothetical protein
VDPRPDVLPFRRAAEPSLPPEPAALPEPTAPLPSLSLDTPAPVSLVQLASPQPRPTAAPVAAPAPRPREQVSAPELSLARFASIRVALWEGGDSLDRQLARHGLDELAWHEDERRLAHVLADEAARGHTDQALALADAMKHAQAEASPEDDVRLTLNDYIALRIALDKAGEAKQVLRAHGITAAAWQRLHKMWQARALADAQVAAKLRARLAAARKASSGGATAERAGLTPAWRYEPYLGPRCKRGA